MKKLKISLNKFLGLFISKKVKMPLVNLYNLSGSKFFLNGDISNIKKLNEFNKECFNIVNPYLLDENFIKNLNEENDLKINEIQNGLYPDKGVKYFNKSNKKIYKMMIDKECDFDTNIHYEYNYNKYNKKLIS